MSYTTILARALTVSHSFLITELVRYGLYKWTVRWVKNRRDCQAQSCDQGHKVQLVASWGLQLKIVTNDVDDGLTGTS